MSVEPRSSAPALLPLLALSVVLAAGCGGGDTDAAAGPPPASAPSVATCNLPDFQAAVLTRVNQFRAAGASCGSRGNFPAAAALSWNARLTNAAAAHSADMVENDFFSHTGSNGSSLANRIDAAGYAWSGIGENIAAGPMTVDAVMSGWMASEGHCANIMNANFREIGVACVPGAAGNKFASYWTMDLGRAR